MTRQGSRGLVIGKFYPPHRGHEYLIRTGKARVDELHVMLFYRSDETIDGELRARWLRQLCPDVVVHCKFAEHRDPYNPADEPGWQAWINEVESVHPGPFQYVFSSEFYGDELARRLHATHIMVDRLRLAVPISGTRVRANPLACQRFLSRPVLLHYLGRGI